MLLVASPNVGYRNILISSDSDNLIMCRDNLIISDGAKPIISVQAKVGAVSIVASLVFSTLHTMSYGLQR